MAPTKTRALTKRWKNLKTLGSLKHPTELSTLSPKTEICAMNVRSISNSTGKLQEGYELYSRTSLSS